MSDTPPPATKPTLKLLTICATDRDGKMPFMAALERAIQAEMPARTGYWLGKIQKVCVACVRDFIEQQGKLLAKHGTPVPDQPGRFTFETEKGKLYAEELASLDHDVELGLSAELKLKLPDPFIPADWLPLMSALDIFAEPE